MKEIGDLPSRVYPYRSDTPAPARPSRDERLSASLRPKKHALPNQVDGHT
jgi:hypothetical protein